MATPTDLAAAPLSDSTGSSITELLHALMDKGYQFLHPRGTSGDVVAIVGVRAHHDVVDIVRLRAESDAEASRVRADEADVFNPTHALWRCSGSVCTVVDGLLQLPERCYTSDTNSNGCWIPTTSGRAKWLAAS